MKSNRHEIEMALGMTYPHEIRDGDLSPLTVDNEAYLDDYRRALGEDAALDPEILREADLERLSHEAPMLFSYLETDADCQGVTVVDLLKDAQGGLVGWAQKTTERCLQDLFGITRRALGLQIAELVKSRHSAPIDQELIGKYQTTLDNELYKAIRALREAQAWRLKAIESTTQRVGEVDVVEV